MLLCCIIHSWLQGLGTWPLSTSLVAPPSSLIKRFNLTLLLSVSLRHQTLSHFLAFVFGESGLFAIVYLDGSSSLSWNIPTLKAFLNFSLKQVPTLIFHSASCT